MSHYKRESMGTCTWLQSEWQPGRRNGCGTSRKARELPVQVTGEATDEGDPVRRAEQQSKRRTWTRKAAGQGFSGRMIRVQQD